MLKKILQILTKSYETYKNRENTKFCFILIHAKDLHV